MGAKEEQRAIKAEYGVPPSSWTWPLHLSLSLSASTGEQQPQTFIEMSKLPLFRDSEWGENVMEKEVNVS